jgi:hypothetical protein
MSSVILSYNTLENEKANQGLIDWFKHYSENYWIIEEIAKY